MAETVVLRIELKNDKQVMAKLADIDAWAAKYNNNPIKIILGGTDLNKYAQELNNVSAHTNGAAESAKKAAAGARDMYAGLQGASQVAKKLNTELSQTHDLMWQIKNRIQYITANAAVSAITKSFKEALATMKEVDSELATVRKVTGMSAAETKALGEQAYSTASKYGVEANEYLESVGTFARAGYKEAAQELGEHIHRAEKAERKAVSANA